ncbi:MAG TPA: tRNA pseudouridine(55) synthase TruB [Candidatus Eisenbacteria bacterium]|nr:tRNA pseudouridine(55) synthase TruB [Candidatus Eisenbacteria bacterium]
MSGALVPPFVGLLALDKPPGPTSHDVVVKVRRRLKSPGAGHLGTLDPGAGGLLLVALGAATRAIPVWQGGEKTYEGVASFGVITSSQDAEGEVLEWRSTMALDESRLREASLAFVGELEQVPPMVSALKVRGERLHRLARRGLDVERAPRRVRVLQWEWLSISLPEAAFRIRCSGGTYIRTLIHDLGQALGPGAILTRLRRTRSEPFGIERSATVEDLDRLTPAEVIAKGGIPLDEALRILPSVELDEPAAFEAGMGGRPLVDPGQAPVGGGERSVVLRDESGKALALGELTASDSADRAYVCPHVVFPWAVRTGRRVRHEGVPWEALSEPRG